MYDPPPPESLVGALQDRVHTDLPGARGARTLRNKGHLDTLRALERIAYRYGLRVASMLACGRCGADVPDCVCEVADV